MSGDSIGAALTPPSGFGDSVARDSTSRAPTPRRVAAEPASGADAPFAVEWAMLLAALACVGIALAWSLWSMHRSVGAAEADRLAVQARVVDENVAQQLEGVYRALEIVRDEFLATAPAHVSTLTSARLKALTESIPALRTMVLLDADGNVVATGVDTLLGRDFSDRQYFRAPKAVHAAQTLHVAAPYKTSLGTYTVVFSRAIVAPNGQFVGAVAAALEPEYFEVLMRSVLYAPDMWVSLAHRDGKVFVTMPRDASRLEADWKGELAGGAGRMTALRELAPASLHMDKPLLIAVSRSEDEVFRAWRRQAIEYVAFYAVLFAVACFGLHRGHARRLAFARLESRAAAERQTHTIQLELALQGGALGLWSWDLASDRFRYVALARLDIGYSKEELEASPDDWRARVHRADVAPLMAALDAHFRGDAAAFECEFRIRHRKGHWVWLLARGRIVERDAWNVPIRMAGTHLDISERKRAEARVERAAEMLRRTGELADIGGWELDLATQRVDWSDQVFRIHELEPGRAPTLEQALEFYAPEARPLIADALAAGARDGTPWDLELPFVTARGRPRWMRAQGVAVVEDGKPVRLLGALQDITERKTTALELHRVNEQLQRLSTTDPLTEVGNRRLFDQTLRTEWARAARRGEPVGLLMIDIDHFKEYNDHYGHPAGDACLRQVARMVGQAMRRGGELVARYGGEEFALLLPGADLDEARQAAERCAKLLEDAKIEHRASATSAWVTISIGVASQPASPGSDCSILVDIADAALYRAKRCGRGRIEY